MTKAFQRVALGLACVLALAACAGKSEQNAADQVGGDPSLPKASNFLLPPMQVPRFTGWKEGAMPTVAPGLK
ncbi:MAG: PQQ-dependent sugar dehydrogenase, partial [Luteibacter jiangsuensis]